jgi:KaiC/GvpD/RAD55 family RecA-like ATPase
MTLQIRVQDLATRVATECKSLRTLLNGNAAGLTALTTTNKTNLVAALNELKAEMQSLASSGGATINDALNASTTQTWSVTKINNAITNAINAVTNGAPGALDTLAELSAALDNNANFAATVTTSLSNRVRTDTAAQGLTTQQKTNARTNIDAFGVGEIGDPTTNFVTTFNAGLV